VDAKNALETAVAVDVAAFVPAAPTRRARRTRAGARRARIVAAKQASVTVTVARLARSVGIHMLRVKREPEWVGSVTTYLCMGSRGNHHLVVVKEWIPFSTKMTFLVRVRFAAPSLWGSVRHADGRPRGLGVTNRILHSLDLHMICSDAGIRTSARATVRSFVRFDRPLPQFLLDGFLAEGSAVFKQ
jgi:hypothetical protein